MPTRLVAAAAAALFVSSAHAATVESFAGYAGPVGGYLLFDRAGLVFSGTAADLNVYPTDEVGGAEPDLEAGNGLAGAGFGNALIIQEPEASGPNAAADGGSFVFTFFEPVDLVAVTLLDVEDGAGVSIASDLGSIVDDASCGGPGCVRVLDFAALPNTDGVGTVTFELAGAGAIDDFTVTPLPNAVVLFASALVALGLWRRHRAG